MLARRWRYPVSRPYFSSADILLVSVIIPTQALVNL
ncbi:hypothetical protein PANA5342_0865 [Pantoea ananatis LMG 5342]|nr:hypothetical protein PANA5342_0865 [Pantoea ananatis LMG 5342]